jgi:hypothetical protein
LVEADRSDAPIVKQTTRRLQLTLVRARIETLISAFGQDA